MVLVHPESLAQTLDSVNHALFTGVKLSKAAKAEAAKYIASRQGLPRSYAATFAPTELDYKAGIRMFTGERISSGAATGHILGEEASHVLNLLGAPNKAVQQALDTANANLLGYLSEHQQGAPGTY